MGEGSPPPSAAPPLDAGGGTGNAWETAAVSLRVAMWGIRCEGMQGPWQQWRWPADEVKRVGKAGLPLAEVVWMVDPLTGCILIHSVHEYRHWPAAVAAETLERPLDMQRGQALRVVLQCSPPRVLSFGPRALRLNEA